MVVRKGAGTGCEPWTEEECAEEGVPGREDSLSKSSEAGGLRRSSEHWQAAWAWGARAKGPILGADSKVKASSVHDTSVVLRSGHVLHGDSKARRKRCC